MYVIEGLVELRRFIRGERKSKRWKATRTTKKLKYKL